jgi:hypothetical protein
LDALPSDPSELAVLLQTIQLTFVAALQRLHLGADEPGRLEASKASNSTERENGTSNPRTGRLR